MNIFEPVAKNVFRLILLSFTLILDLKNPIEEKSIYI